MAHEDKDLIEKIKELDYFIFDFDGTLYPGLLLSELVFDFLKDYGLKNPSEQWRYDELDSIFKNRDLYSFDELCNRSALLLKDVERDELLKKLPLFMDKCYPSSLELIALLRQMGKKCFLSSLTIKEIASAAKAKYSFDGCVFRDLDQVKVDGKTLFTGKYTKSNLDLGNYKIGTIEAFGLKSKKFLMAGNAIEDKCLLIESEISVGVNPQKELKEGMVFDVFLSDQKDPWETLVDNLKKSL